MELIQTAIENSDEEQEEVCWIDLLPIELLLEIFDRLTWELRLKAEIVSPKWNQILKERGWSRFTQCCLTKHWYSPDKIHTLFTRCGPSLRELIFDAPRKEDRTNTNQANVSEILGLSHLLRKLDTICIINRRLAQLPASIQSEALGQIRCLHLEACFYPQDSATAAISLVLKASTMLRYLNMTRTGHHLHVNSFFQAQFGELRHIRLEDTFGGIFHWLQFLCHPAVAPKLIGMTFNVGPVENALNANIDEHNLDVQTFFQRLQHLEINFDTKLAVHRIINMMKRTIPRIPNVRILSVSHIDGEILSSIVRHCPHIEQLEYSTHHASVFGAFPGLCQLTQLRVLHVRHYGPAKPNRTPIVMLETLRELSSAAKLEHLSLNLQLPSELVLHIVQKYPRLSCLEYGQPLTNLVPLNRALDEMAEARQNAPLHFRIGYSSWLKHQHAAKNCRKPKLRHGPPCGATQVMREYWSEVFEGGHVPKFLLQWPKSEEEENKPTERQAEREPPGTNEERRDAAN